MLWLTSMFFPDIQKMASSSDFGGCKNLNCPAFASMNLVKVSVSERFLSQFWGREPKTDLCQFASTKFPLLWYMRLIKCE